jgi:hypothetical protein
MDGARRAAARPDLALDTYKYGYFLLDIIELDPQGTGHLATELLIRRASPDALVARGPVEADWLHALADRHRLVVHPEETRDHAERA